MTFDEWIRKYNAICQAKGIHPGPPQQALWSFDDQISPEVAAERLFNRVVEGNMRRKAS